MPLRSALLPRVLDRLRHHLDADGLPAVPRQGEGDRARAAVHVAQHVRRGQRREGPRRLVEALGLAGIHLKERRGRQVEGQAAEHVGQRVRAAQGAEARAEDHVGARGVFVQDDGRCARGRQARRPGRPRRADARR